MSLTAEATLILKWTTLLGVTGLLLASPGCNSANSKGSDDRKPTALQRDDITTIDRWAVESPQRASMEAAIVRERILYDYHFVDGTARLTPLGRRDAEILARHFRGETWTLSIRQGNVDDGLYASRIKTVRSLMTPLGVTGKELVVVDSHAGGDGIASADARRIRRQSEQGAGSLKSGNDFNGGTEVVRPIDTPLEGGS